MSDETMNEEQPGHGLPPLPMLAEEDEPYEEPEEQQAPEADPIPRRRGGRGRGRGPQPQQQAQQPQAPRVDDLDEWIMGLNWQAPSMQVRVARLAPTWFKGQQVAGHLDQRDGEPYTTAELKERFGGGTYKVDVFGAPDGAQIRRLGSRKVTIAGVPVIEGEETLPLEGRFARPGFSPVGGDDRQVAKGLVGILAQEQTELRRAALDSGRANERSIDQVQESHKAAVAAIERAAEERARAREESARELTKQAQQRLEEERAERLRLSEELRQKEADHMATMDKLRTEIASTMQGSNDSTLKLLTAFFPAMSAQKSEETQSIMREYAAKEERLMAQHQTALQNQQSIHQQALESERQRATMQAKQIESSYENILAVLKLQLQGKDNEITLLQRQVEDLRRNAEEAQKKLVDYVTMSKDTGSKLGEVAAIMQTVNELKDSFGGGGSGGGGDDEEGMNPVMRIANKVATNLPAIAEAWAASKQQQQQPQMMMPPPGYAMMPQQPMQPQMMQPQMMQPPPMQMQRQPAPPKRPAAPPKPKIKKEDLEQACMIMDAVLSQPEPTSPEEFARMAMGQVDNAMLRELARRSPDKVIAQLEAAGMLSAKLASEEGKAWITAVLVTLKDLLPPAPAAQK